MSARKFFSLRCKTYLFVKLCLTIFQCSHNGKVSDIVLFFDLLDSVSFRLFLDFHTIPRDAKDNRHIAAMFLSQTKEIIKILLLRVHQCGRHDVKKKKNNNNDLFAASLHGSFTSALFKLKHDNKY